MKRHAEAPFAGATPSRHREHSRLQLLVSLCLATAIAGCLLASSASAFETRFYTGTSFGPDGTAATSFERASALAIDQSNDFIYVAEVEKGAVEKFTLSGAPSDFSSTPGSNSITGIGFLGGTGESQIAVDPPSGNIYATTRNSILAFKPSGEPLEFSAGPDPGTNEISGFGELLGVAVDSEGNIYAGDYGFGGVVSVYAPTGAFITSFPSSGAGNLAVDAGGTVYVNNYHGEVRKYVPDAPPISPATTYSDEGVIDSKATYTVSVDQGSGDLYVDHETSIAQYDSLGVKQSEFAAVGAGAVRQSTGVALDEGADVVYVSDRAGDKQVAIYGQSVILPDAETADPTTITSTTATLAGAVNPSGEPVQECFFEYGRTEAYGQVADCEDPDAAELGTGTASIAVHASIAGLSPGTEYHFRLVAKNANGTTRGEDVAFATSGPFISGERVISALDEEAVVQADINPAGSASDYIVEYGLTSSYDRATAPRAVGADEAFHQVRAALTGLTPGAVFHYRFVATNAEGTTEGADQTFQTPGTRQESGPCPNEAFRSGPAALLPNCRAYEMVSPVDKNNGDIIALINNNSNLAMLDQASPDGSKITYTSYQGFGDPVGVPYVSQYVASRNVGGWTSRSITAPQGTAITPIGKRIDLEFEGFTPNLCSGVLLQQTEPLLAAGGQGGFPNLYRRDNCGPAGYEPLTTVPYPPGQSPVNVELRLQGMSTDGQCVVFAVIPMLYESCRGQLQPVNVLPDGELSAIGFAGTSPSGPSRIRSGSLLGAVSGNGSRVYWTAAGGDGPLYLRLNSNQPKSPIVNGECVDPAKACTIPVSEPVSSEPAHFWSATPDGSKAFFSVAQSTGQRTDLYQFDAASQSSSLIANNVFGVIGAGVTGARISFASEKVLSSTPNSEGDTPTLGQPNLYLFDESQAGANRYQFVGQLTATDAEGSTIFKYSPLNLEPFKKVSRVSPDGRHITFMSAARLTGYDNTDANSGEADYEVFLFSGASESTPGILNCLSCNPSGQRPVGRDLRVQGAFLGNWAAALLPPYATNLYGSRVVSDNGQRAYFTSYDALLPRDTNGKADVYQWEAPNSGDCRQGSPSYSAANGGCLSLISTGSSPSDSEFIDASADGRDVFFSTASSLRPEDPGLIDIYDAREGGGYPLPPGRTASCEGEACQGPLVPPNDPTPASAAFNGPGNLRERGKPRCAKGKARRKGRCVAQRKGKQAKRAQHRAANSDRRAGR